jgi:hypothetical protein
LSFVKDDVITGLPEKRLGVRGDARQVSGTLEVEGPPFRKRETGERALSGLTRSHDEDSREDLEELREARGGSAGNRKHAL